MIYELELTEQIILSAIEVHRILGPGLLESAYEECLCCELENRRLFFERQKGVPIKYKGRLLNCQYRLDLLVENRVICELKCVEQLLLIHKIQLLTYLRLCNVKVGLLFNFNVPVLKNGLVRVVS